MLIQNRHGEGDHNSEADGRSILRNDANREEGDEQARYYPERAQHRIAHRLLHLQRGVFGHRQSGPHRSGDRGAARLPEQQCRLRIDVDEHLFDGHLGGAFARDHERIDRLDAERQTKGHGNEHDRCGRDDHPRDQRTSSRIRREFLFQERAQPDQGPGPFRYG